MDLLVIPARAGSTRFPRKPLALLAGRTLLARSVDLARRGSTRHEGVSEIVVATDDEAIASHAAELGVRVAMTPSSIASGSGRALAAAMQQSTAPRRVVNLQVDAPLLPCEAIGAVLRLLPSDGVFCATPAVRLDWAALDALRDHKRISPFSGTTCIAGAGGDAVWFSKAVIPAIRDEARRRERETVSPVLRHLGLYAYTLAALERFEASPPVPYELLEGLEQLRLVHLGVPIRLAMLDGPAVGISGIDTPADLASAEALIARDGDPYGT